ncbi:hypothetical protein AXF42_Ash010209 [Apostasia shenzhenica]|uniref:Uncharacterized protein n=1 Tax=Apostasia shenzhenica TaxID=1088818 RepID=A0A2I0A9S1_9ASPA|nr:hypothetical protein AXF42_Ash010209 [Apostasia shenzhenica]
MDLIFEWPVEALVFRYSATIGGSLCTCLALLAAALSFWRFRFLGSASASKTPDAAAVVSLTPSPPPPSAATNSFREPPIFASAVPDRLCREDCQSSPKGRFTAYFLAEEDVNGGEEEVEIDGVNDVLDGFRRLDCGWRGDLGWYCYQDRKTINGSVVRLWDGRQRGSAAALATQMLSI